MNEQAIPNEQAEQKEQEDQIEQPKEQTPRSQHQGLPREWRYMPNYPMEYIIGDPSQGVQTRSSKRLNSNNMALLSQIEPKNVKEALLDESWIHAMQEELNQFEKNEVWRLVLEPINHLIIGTKWVFHNK